MFQLPDPSATSYANIAYLVHAIYEFRTWYHNIHTWYAYGKFILSVQQYEYYCVVYSSTRIINEEQRTQARAGLLSYEYHPGAARLRAQLEEAVWPIADPWQAATAPRHEMR